jgi:glycosyltransferase involved in cell wall biosynthesis
MFEAGRAIDVSYYSNFLPNSCHQEIELKFINERRGQTADAPLITVDMAAYNAELHIKEAIDSVLNQTYKNFELLIVDDGSTDSTRDIIAAYDDNRIKYIFQKHKNLAAARNNVIKNARGKYILCLDSDDYLAPKYIEEMVAVAENHPDIDLFYPGALTLVDESSNLTGARWEYLDFEDNKILPAFLFEHGFSPIPNPGSLKRRTLFEKIRHYDDLDCTEDFALLCRNALKINFKRVDNLPTCYYRKDGKGLSLKFDVRDRITADTLNLMTKLYPPRILCPNLKGMTNTHSSKIQYYKFLASTFYKHADGYHMVKHGKFFKQYGDHYKEKLNDLINQKQITLLADHLSDSKKLLKKAQKILQKQGNS